MTGNNNTNGVSTATANGNSILEMAQSNQDLLLTKKQSKKKKNIVTAVIAAVVIGLIIALIVIFVSMKSKDENDVSQAAALTLEDYLHSKLIPRGFNGSWASGNQIIYTDHEGNVVLMGLKDNSTRILIESNDTLLLSAFDFQLSADGLYLLVAQNYGKLYRHSYLAQYVIIDLSNEEKIAILDGDIPIPLVKWAPVGNGLVYVFQNNIYYKSSVVSTAVLQITSTSGAISNGIPDWVYEEEIFSSNKAMWFSPDGRKLAFGRFDDTNVPVMVVPVYGEPGKMNSQYPRASLIRYPKAGTTNPTVSLHYVDLADPSEEYELRIPSNITKEQILTAVEWANNNSLIAIWMNRVQNQAYFVYYDTSTNPTTSITVTGVVSSDGWLELFTPTISSKDGSQFVVILSRDQGGDAGAFRHVILYNVEENNEGQDLTIGKFVVTEIVGWNHKDNLIFFLANTEEFSSVQHLYSVSPDTKEIKCHTCNMSSDLDPSLQCLYNTVDFSKDNEYYLHTCAGPGVPQTSLYTKNGEKILTWNDNKDLAAYIKGKLTPTLKTMEFDIADGFKAKVLLKLPPNMDTTGNTKYPMLVNVYGGPDTYQVTDKFYMDWGSYLSANKSIIYAAIDGRNSGLRGDKLMFAGFRKLGTVEVIDQINVTKHIQNSLPYVDASRTGIWGWSYGGYVSGMALATDNEGIFKCGISVAPVTDWALYDSIYTERFMGLPTVEDNLKAYEDAQLLKKYEGLRDKEYFLIHGTHDDNVHYQQSMMWSKVLELNGILFRQQSYPDEDHNLNNVRPHLYHSLESFLDECFIGERER